MMYSDHSAKLDHNLLVDLSVCIRAGIVDGCSKALGTRFDAAASLIKQLAYVGRTISMAASLIFLRVRHLAAALLFCSRRLSFRLSSSILHCRHQDHTIQYNTL